MMGGERDIEKIVLDGIRDAGLALLHDNLAMGARRASDTLARVTGGLEAGVVLLGGWEDAPVPWDPVSSEGTPLGRFLMELLEPARVKEWSSQGTDIHPAVVPLDGNPSEAARELRENGAGSVLAVPLPGTTGVRGLIGAVIPEGSTLEERQLEAAVAIAQLAGIGIDVLMRALAAEETEHRLRRFIGQLPDPALLLDPSGVVREASEMAQPVFGLAPQDLLGRPLGEILEKGENGRFLDVLREAVESGAARGVFSAAGQRKGEARRIEIKVRRFSERRLLAVARDVTLQVRREHNLRVLLKHAPGMMASRDVEELWGHLLDSVKELLPAATYIWIYRGEPDRVRMVWSSNPLAPPWEFRLRGWGSDVSGMLSQEEARDEFIRRYGANERVARETLTAILEGRGTPMLLDNPTEQLAIYLSDQELEQILMMWGDSPPGQLIHCPVIVKGHMELLVVVDAPTGERPFVPEDATYVWQLTNLAYQTLGRIEGSELARRQLGELEIFLEAMRQVGEARGGKELLEVLVHRVMEALDADRGRLLALEETGWRCELSFGPEGPPRGAAVTVPRFPEDGSGRPRLLYLPDAGNDSGWQALAGEGSRSLVALPLTSMGRFQGALLLATGRRWEFTASEHQLAEFFADEIALVMAQVNLTRSVIEANAGLHNVMDAVHVGIVLCDAQTRLVRINRSAASLFQLVWPVTVGRSVIELFPPQVRRSLAEALERTLDRGTLGTVLFELRGSLLRVEIHPRMEGGAILVIGEREGVALGGIQLRDPSPETLHGAELGRLADEWERVETMASHLNDLLTALSGQLELAGARGVAVPEEALRLVQESCLTGEELGRLLGAARPDRRGRAGEPGSASDPDVS